MNKKRLLFASSEVYPFVKTGGLADVSHSLPKALNEMYDVSVVLPLYSQIDRSRFSLTLLNTFEIMMGGVSYTIELHGTSYEGVEYRFIYAPILCDRDYLYGPPESGYEDNGIRFGLFSHAITQLLRIDSYAIAHLNDWQCALAALFVKEDPSVKTKIVYTIHNLAYQGVFPPSVMGQIGLNERYFTMDALEFYDQVNFMKAGIAYADAVTTVSPTYAKEILTAEFGCGLEGFLHLHRRKLRGIVNGIDSDHFSPSTDKALVAPYKTLKGKKASKNDLLKQFGLKGAAKPLLVFIGRFTHQKGMDVLIETLPKIAELECNIALLGEGEEAHFESLEKIAKEYKNVSLQFGYDESIAHRMYAAADFLLMPSLFEPCGLNQMIAFAYGAVPVVNKVGGLADTVKKFESYDAESPSGFGIVFTSATPKTFFTAVKKGCDLYADKKHFESIVNHNMKCNYSWSESAKAYDSIYKKLIK
ncbi:glycogen/starch synthase, ADP-glucose type [Sulfuricurvum kujiense DSM 16994]|uniref:Glycogen synthase n=1 Tax=Sulfuricurvum kujiense (strain ATCC BAA-921 / DSM 16994 / JCM 11577 / YK-1) TaxID=709032 RepID=E4TXM1_SULKY|nr:glycogen/starch synthase [Sulfuricurvum kujiense]ADR33930.1 glycogen/starch synthase, ADP-glucose type [Sulfuricurvum kujiense DSM 16994]